MVIVILPLRRQRRADRGHGRARAVHRDGNSTPGKVRRAPTGNSVLRPETIGAGRAKVSRLTAGFNVRALATAGAAGARTAAGTA